MFDELNYFEYEKEDIEEQFRQYFREMPDITEEQVEERKDVALDIFDLMLLFMFMVNGNEYTKQYQDLDYYISMIQRNYLTIIDNHYGSSEAFNEYASNFARNVVNTTFSHQDEDYYLSQDRAINIAENEANTIANEEDYQRAIDKGFKFKKWLTERDEKVRKTHKAVEGVVKPIKDFFIVGGSRMLYPHDAVNGAPKEVIGCRCHIAYLNDYKSENDTVIKAKIPNVNDDYKSLTTNKIENYQPRMKMNLQFFSSNADDYDTIPISEHLRSEINNWVTKEQLDDKIFYMDIGAYHYKIYAKEFDDYKILRQWAIDGNEVTDAEIEKIVNDILGKR